MITLAHTAKQEISDFLASKEAGIRSEFKKITLQNAASTMFTANGLRCPVAFIERDGDTFIFNRDIVSQNGSDVV